MTKRFYQITVFLFLVLLVLWIVYEKGRYTGLSVASRAQKPKAVAIKEIVQKVAIAPIGESAGASFQASFLTPIIFYGKVIDQNGQIVPNADLKVRAMDKPWGASEYIRKADEKGFFKISGLRGIKLSIAVSKKGYLEKPLEDSKVTSSGMFDYSDVGGGVHKPDRNNPVVFELYKVGPLESLVRVERYFRFAMDGSPLLIPLDGKGGHTVILKCWNKSLERPQGQYQYDWRFEITVPSGEMLLRKSIFSFQAPDGNYVPKEEIDMPESLSQDQWRSSVERSYFIRFEDGVFARVDLSLRAMEHNSVQWESFLNPRVGSRNLEFDPGR